MALDQNKIMLGLRVRVVRGTYTGRTGTIKEIVWSDPDFRDYICEVVIKWDRSFQGRKTDIWCDFSMLEEITEPDEGALKPSRMQAGWKIQLCSMPRSKFFRKIAEVTKVVRGSYFIVQWNNGATMKWDIGLAPLFCGIPKPISPKKTRKLEREALLAETFYHGA